MSARRVRKNSPPEAKTPATLCYVAGMLNLSFYKFLPLSGLPALQADLRALGKELGLRGTILLSEEGVNAMLTGEDENVRRFREKAVTIFGHCPSFKEGFAPEHSFHRLLVKIKKEIISVGDPALKPHQRTAARLSAEELKRWLDEGRDFHFLDTRNDYEVEVGTFRGATHLGLECSRDFAKKAKEKTAQWADKPVVTFCTGGIRCEKASAFLLEQGLANVYQLDGGILRYFEKTGGAHFDGLCFVYDWRLAVNGKLEPSPRSEDGRAFGRHKLPPDSDHG